MIDLDGNGKVDKWEYAVVFLCGYAVIDIIASIVTLVV